MNDGGNFTAGIVVGVILSALAVYFVIISSVMAYGFQYGKTVQCVGQSGYHFVCEEPKK